MKKLNIIILTIFLLFAILGNTVYGNTLLKVIPEKVIAVMELADSETIKNFSEMNLGSFGSENDAFETEDYKIARENARKELGFDALDPIFMENIFSQGAVIACVGVSIGGNPELLISLIPSDQSAFLNFIEAVEAENELEEKTMNYKDIEIVEIILPSETDPTSIDSIFYTFLEDKLVIGNLSLPVKKAIDVYKGDILPLFENSEYEELKAKTLEKIEFSTFFACLFSNELYGVVDELSEIVEDEELAKTLESSRATLENSGNISLAGGYQEKNFAIYMMALQKNDDFLNLFKEIDIIDFQSLHMFPKNTFFYLAGLTPLTWEAIKEGMVDKNLETNLDENMGQIQNKTGIDIDNILAVLPSQEFSLGLFDPSGLFPKVGLLSGFSSEEKLEQYLYPILQTYAPMVGGQLMDGEYDGTKYKSLLNPMFPIAYGVIGDRFAASTGINDMIDVQKGNRKALNESEAIRYILSFPNVFSLLYIDMDPITQIAQNFIQMSKQMVPQSQNTPATNQRDPSEAVMENLKNLKNLLFWAGIEEDYVYAWLEINYK